MSKIENIAAPPRLNFAQAALFLDIDGTLLDIALTPHAVCVPSILIWAIEVLNARLHGAIAFVSGRPLEEIDMLFHPLKLASVGCHGAQIRLSPDAEIEKAMTIPAEVKDRVSEILNLAPGIALEDKGYTLAVHYRRAPDSGPMVLRALMERRQFLDRFDLQLLKGKCVIEIKPRWFNKGTALRRLMAHSPFTGRTPVFIGDDMTDEDVFRALPDYDGIGLAVGRAIPGAAHVFDTPKTVRNWLVAQAQSMSPMS